MTGLAAPPLAVGEGRFRWYAAVFFVLALGATVFGMRGVAGLSTSIAKILVVVFLVLAVVSLLL